MYELKKWVIKAKKADFEEIGRKHGISPILARLIINRDISENQIDYYLNATLADLYDPFLMKGVNKACDMLIDSIKNAEHIRVVGDYDADGVCSSYILIKGLRTAGGNVSYRLPHRIRDGYGLNISMIEEAHEAGVDLIITCDNGIAAANEIKRAKELGIKVIVTDHHSIPFEEIGGEKQYILPEADCIVNPHQPDDEYPYKTICGAMVAYKLMLALQKKIDDVTDLNDDVDEKNNGLHKITKEITDELLDFTAFATVTDIMPLLDENRVVLKYGLRSMRATKNIGLSCLIDATGVKRDRLDSYHIGFILGPSVNAVGRLYSADIALELFLADDYDDAMSLANTLKAANEERKAIEESKLKEAFKIVENGADGHDYTNDTVYIVYVPDCHESLAGLIAGKIKEKYCRPTIVFTDCETGIKGSGRSIDCYNIAEEIAKYKDLLQKFGGHPMACGLSMDKENFEEFRRRINEDSYLTEENLVDKYYIDIDMPISYVSFELINEIERLAPFGEGNRKPLFAQKNLSIVSRKSNPKGNLMTLQVKTLPFRDKPERTMYATMFGEAKELLERLSGKDIVTLAYEPEYNDYYERLQLRIKDFI